MEQHSQTDSRKSFGIVVFLVLCIWGLDNHERTYAESNACLLYTSDAADDTQFV